jgi:hypothetical protein
MQFFKIHFIILITNPKPELYLGLPPSKKKKGKKTINLEPPWFRMPTKTLFKGFRMLQIFIRTLTRGSIVLIKISKPKPKVP